MGISGVDKWETGRILLGYCGVDRVWIIWRRSVCGEELVWRVCGAMRLGFGAVVGAFILQSVSKKTTHLGLGKPQ